MMTALRHDHRPELRGVQTPAHGWVAAGLLVVLGTFTVLNVHTHAVHAGMAEVVTAGTMSGQASSVDQTQSRPSGHMDTAGGVAPGDPERGSAPGTHPDGQHALHLLGACLALLAAGVALVMARKGLARWPSAPGECRRVVVGSAHAWAWRGPPALRPPTTSPVIRT